MQITHKNALLRALSTCAKFLRFHRKAQQTEGTALPPMTDHIAQDIGLTPSQRAQMKHRWPSEENRHPYL
ncbi:hypothetical protein [Tateyamaria sp. ANG-S1]|uniref:hypothetical protein n=1 Tax=Tateyamaria sp. ANG-S1 TaxID=1577905 RepID=UPI00057F6A59|nr:hypothetical protein [Tateyamaria sp. ANG-S1]KIC51957.1 hypothetical protein RA29_01305 [Tateyamaria sp. ANG-S1]